MQELVTVNNEIFLCKILHDVSRHYRLVYVVEDQRGYRHLVPRPEANENYIPLVRSAVIESDNKKPNGFTQQNLVNRFDDTKPLSENLSNLLEWSGGSVSRIAKVIGVAPDTFRTYLGGQIPSRSGRDKLITSLSIKQGYIRKFMTEDRDKINLPLLASKLNRYRTTHNLSFAKMGQVLNTSANNVIVIEKSRHVPTDNLVLERLFEVLGITAKDVWLEEFRGV